jgi:quercetin dioxygenase-like cupin family protein
MKSVQLSEIQAEGVSHNPEITKRVMLRNGDVPRLTNFSQSRFAPGQSAVAHSHADMYEVFFVEAGRGVISVDGAEHALEPGRCVMVEPGEVHELRNDGADELVLTYFGIAAQPPTPSGEYAGTGAAGSPGS